MIFVVNDGAIVERGNHEDLLKRGGLYAELYHVYQGDTEASQAIDTKPVADAVVSSVG